MNKLTELSNQLTNAIKKDSEFNNEVAINLQIHARLIKEEIINIKYAVQWAKINVINTFLLDESELENVFTQFKNANTPLNSIEEMMEFADVSVLHNKTTMLYIVKIPIVQQENFNNLIIRPVVKNNKIVNLKFNEIFQNQDQILGINKNCKSINKLKICDKSNIVSLRYDNCLARLLIGEHAMCEFSNADHIPVIEEIDSTRIILNNFNGSVRYNGSRQHLDGTYLINFWNSTIQINNREFSNTETTLMKMMPPVIQLTPTETEHLRILSLEALEALHINNTEQLQLLRTHTSIDRFTFCTLFGVAVLITIGINMKCHKKKKIILQMNSDNPPPKPPRQLQSIQIAPIRETKEFANTSFF